VLVWYPIGVKKLKLAANMTARINGLAGKSNPAARVMAIGVTMTAVALLDIKPLINMVIANSTPKIIILSCPVSKFNNTS